MRSANSATCWPERGRVEFPTCLRIVACLFRPSLRAAITDCTFRRRNFSYINATALMMRIFWSPLFATGCNKELDGNGVHPGVNLRRGWRFSFWGSIAFESSVSFNLCPRSSGPRPVPLMQRMDSGYYAAMTGLVARSQALDTAASNLANAQTPGYRAEREYFRSVFLGPDG